MALVIQNVRLAHRIYRLTVQGSYSARMGQFFMLRCWDAYPVLSRPISIHNLTEDSVSFLYRVHGTGTWLLSALQAGDKIQLEGPFGQGFPEPQGRTALVGGGIEQPRCCWQRRKFLNPASIWDIPGCPSRSTDFTKSAAMSPSNPAAPL